MDIRNVKYFLAVADTGSITKAAKVLHLSQPPLSTAMSKLESELGVQLFERMPRGIALTPAGRYLQAAGRRLIAEEQRLSSALRSMGKGLEGELRLGAEILGLWSIISGKIAEFLTENPRVALDLMDAHPQVQLDHLANGHLDLALVPVIPEEPPAPIHSVAFETDVIARLPMVVIVPSTWGEANCERIELAELRDQTWILPAPLGNARSLSRLLDDRFALAGGRPSNVLSVQSIQTAARLVAAGVGVAVASAELADHHPDVSAVPIKDGLFELPLGLVRRKSGIVTPVAERFAELLRSGPDGDLRTLPDDTED
ncbi:LysR family transcriptional regulator [Streptomyces brasiliensis]|uniref:LysR family transcriptional regulator n=1 Tax=Streptomyces brasiliensis TaxID=1954 RepID=A0A917P7P5_9ACTN|nr:LysR family transcriptional regulator [Streptomyces brasiliensis]GGJ65682.1 LysR family transcriptional regulator [Streptomyces brasiliensis]